MELPPVVILSGFVTAASVSLSAQLSAEGVHGSLLAVLIRAMLEGIVGSVSFPLVRLAVLSGMRFVLSSPVARARYDRWERWTYAAFTLTAFSALGLQLILPVVLAIASTFLIAQVWFLLPGKSAGGSHVPRLTVLFAMSGAAALIYQVIWQRALFGAIGANIEAVTLVVSVFMLGLGLGSLLGGLLSQRFSERLPAVFALLELSVAGFGIVSLPLIASAGRWVGAASIPTVALVLMLVLLPPTLLMGATLPVLVAHVNRVVGDVGRSVGTLYFANTLGSAAACFATVLVAFAFLGLRTSVFVAVGMNVAVAILVNAIVVHPRALNS